MSAVRPVLDVVAGHGPGVGAGHLGRCLALAEAWIAAGGTARLVDDGAIASSWAARYRAAGAVTVPVDAAPAAWTVIDDYQTTPDAVARRRAHGRVLLIDDHGTTGTIEVDWLLDQNLGATTDPYPVAPIAGVPMLGTSFALVRREVAAARPAVAPDRTVPPRRFLVAVGGDPHASVRRAAGDAADELASAHHLEPVWLEGVHDVGALLASVDLAVSAAGSTCWDLCAHGVPSAVVAVAPNQQPIARALAAHRAAVDAGDLGPDSARALVTCVSDLVADPARRQALADRGRGLVDGRGADRVVAVLLER